MTSPWRSERSKEGKLQLGCGQCVIEIKWAYSALSCTYERYLKHSDTSITALTGKRLTKSRLQLSVSSRLQVYDMFIRSHKQEAYRNALTPSATYAYCYLAISLLHHIRASYRIPISILPRIHIPPSTPSPQSPSSSPKWTTLHPPRRQIHPQPLLSGPPREKKPSLLHSIAEPLRPRAPPRHSPLPTYPLLPRPPRNGRALSIAPQHAHQGNTRRKRQMRPWPRDITGQREAPRGDMT